MPTFVPRGFAPPRSLVHEAFVLEPLRPELNEADHAAWTSSLDHIRATPGFARGGWPRPMTLEENRADLEAHARDFAAGTGFTYTVLDPDGGDVIGCVYVYPADDGVHDASVRSWVRVSHARLDEPLRRAVTAWLASDAWPFATVAYARRGPGG